MFLGVAGGIADYFGIDPTLVRIVWVIAALVMAPMTAPGALVLYLILGLIVPESPRE
jgi:phage shock protein PspC (stress-responsive transcriptional regulator)